MKNCRNHTKSRIVLIALQILLLSSCGKTEKLAVYSCANQYDADECNKGCDLEKDMKYSFLVSKEEKSVLKITYWNDKQSGSIISKNCTVIENLNWDCSESTSMPYKTWNTENKMTNGLFTEKFRQIRDSDLKLLNPKEKGTCAK